MSFRIWSRPVVTPFWSLVQGAAIALIFCANLGCPPVPLASPDVAVETVELPLFSADSVITAPGGGSIVAGMVLVDFADDATLSDIDSVLGEHGLARSGLIGGVNLVLAQILDGRDETTVREALSGVRGVESSMLNHVIKLNAATGAVSPVYEPRGSGPKYALSQDELKLNWPLYVMDALPALALADTVLAGQPEPDVVLAVVDSGFQEQLSDSDDATEGSLLTSPSSDQDLAPKLVEPTGYRVARASGTPTVEIRKGPARTISNSLIGSKHNLHGLLAAGPALAAGQDLLGTGRHVRFRPVRRTLEATGESGSDYAIGMLKWLADENAPNLRVLNLSFGLDQNDPEERQRLAEAFAPHLNRLVEGNRIVVMAAGNDGLPTEYSAMCILGPTRDRVATPRRGNFVRPAHAGIMVVGGSGLPRFVPQRLDLDDPVDFLANVAAVLGVADYPATLVFEGQAEHWMNYSSPGGTVRIAGHFGPHVSVSAPAEAVPSLRKDFTSLKLTFGTSVAAPYVAGLAAELFAVDPTASNVDIIEIIEQTADDVGSPGEDDFTGFGRVNCWKAMLTLLNRANPAEPRWVGVRYRWNLPDRPAPEQFAVGGASVPDAGLKRVPALLTNDNTGSVPWPVDGNIAYEACFSFETSDLDRPGDIAFLEGKLLGGAVHQLPLRRSDVFSGRLVDAAADDYVLTLDLETPTASIYGRVTANGQPLAGAEVQYTTHGGTASVTTTDAGGWYTAYDALPDASFDLSAGAAGWTRDVIDVRVPAMMAYREDFDLIPELSDDFVVLTYTNPDGTSGTGAEGAVIKLSGNPEFPQFSWSGLQAVRLLVDMPVTTRIDYGIEAINGFAGPYLAPPVRYGDYAVPDARRYIDASVSVFSVYPSVRYTVTLQAVEGRATVEFEVR